MATKNMAYDHAAYLARMGAAVGEVGGSAAQFGKFAAYTAMLAFAAQVTVTTAGTSGGTQNFLKISGTTTTTLATTTLGTAAAGTTTNVLLTNVAGGVALAQGDILSFQAVDSQNKAALVWEVQALPLANVTA
jgi:hypothetical protein